MLPRQTGHKQYTQWKVGTKVESNEDLEIKLSAVGAGMGVLVSETDSDFK